MSFVADLRAATAADHDAVDARFGALSGDGERGYRRMLRAHARALPAIEAALTPTDRTADAEEWPDWQPRTAALIEDLAALDLSMPSALPFATAPGGMRWGALYVLEGSRLGGQVLAREVGQGRPVAYLSARHRPGEWRALLATLEVLAARHGRPWQDAAIAGARATFDLYLRAAAAEDAAVGNDEGVDALCVEDR